MDAVAEEFAALRQEIDDRLAALDGNALLKSSSMALARAHLKVLNDRFACIGNRTSVPIKGTPPDAVKALFVPGKGV